MATVAIYVRRDALCLPVTAALFYTLLQHLLLDCAHVLLAGVACTSSL